MARNYNNMNENELLSKDESLIADITKCENCGGQTHFNPTLQKLECEYCGSIFDIKKDSAVDENPIEDLLINGKVWKDAEVIKCVNCGAKEIISKGELAVCCSFCGTTNIVKSDEIVGMKPQGVCPFEKSINDATAIAKKWCAKKIFAPNGFKKSAKAENINGLYSPVFAFDCSTTSSYYAVLGETKYYTYRNSQGRTVTRSKTRTFSIRGKVSKNFDDLIVQASANVPEKIMNKLEPFPTKNALLYNKSFLSGFTANTYSKDGNQSWRECKEIMYSLIKREILSKYHYDFIVNYNQNTDYFKTKFKYVLLPLYVGHHIYKSKIYNFFINGSTGKIVGKSPISAWKIILTVLAGIVVLVGFFALASYIESLGRI